jgi:DNA-binding transcriptional LysR family regulator
MVLDSYALEAFLAVTQNGTFTKAAGKLRLTQSALSQRIAGLEGSLGVTLFLRQRQGIRLTPAGKRLLQYVQAKEKFEEELLGELKENSAALEGTMRVTGFSSVVRSILIPSLAPLLQKNPQLRLELQSKEIFEIADTLLQGETDFTIHFEEIAREGVRSELLGHEEYVLVEARKGSVAEAFLDHHENDEVTLRYLRRFDTGKAKILRRYLDEVYALIDGVCMGLGRAVLPRHLVEHDERLRILQPIKALRVPVYLNYFEQPYYTRLQSELLSTLKQGFKKYL